MLHRKIKISILILLLGLTWPILSISTSSAASSNSSNVNISQSVIQSYNGPISMQIGMIVQLQDKTTNTIAALTQNNMSNMLGVIVPANAATVALTPENNTTQQYYVASTGRYNVLVSSENGSISSGDYITISSLDGIGMKADQNQSLVLGRATGTFNSHSIQIGTVTVTDQSGKKKQVSIGLVPVQLSISHNPLASKSVDYVPSFLAKAAATVAAKPVSAARIYLGLLTLFVSTVLTAILLYSGIRSGMISIGRNPLSRTSIIRSLIQTVAAGLIIFIIGVFAVYLLLKL